ncbi:hypothetical protein ACWC9T_32530 [Kitasatospora sp. NPDC001159]
MTGRHFWSHRRRGPAAVQQRITDARRAGISHFQVLALVHRERDRERILLLEHHGDGVWGAPDLWNPAHPQRHATAHLAGIEDITGEPSRRSPTEGS